jgi:hypothetical protein
MARVFTLPANPSPRHKRQRNSDPRFLEGQRMIAEAIRYLAQSDPHQNQPAIFLLSEHFRTQFRMSDLPQR